MPLAQMLLGIVCKRPCNYPLKHVAELFLWGEQKINDPSLLNKVMCLPSAMHHSKSICFSSWCTMLHQAYYTLKAKSIVHTRKITDFWPLLQTDLLTGEE